jgi:enamine deaminase RidA (YjgF/YER057c/UK114 family)
VLQHSFKVEKTRVGRFFEPATHVVRLAMYIAATLEFTEHPKVPDAASELLPNVFGEQTISSQLVIGVASLPLDSPVELEVILEVKARVAPSAYL